MKSTIIGTVPFQWVLNIRTALAVGDAVVVGEVVVRGVVVFGVVFRIVVAGVVVAGIVAVGVVVVGVGVSGVVVGVFVVEVVFKVVGVILEPLVGGSVYLGWSTS